MNPVFPHQCPGLFSSKAFLTWGTRPLRESLCFTGPSSPNIVCWTVCAWKQVHFFGKRVHSFYYILKGTHDQRVSSNFILCIYFLTFIFKAVFRWVEGRNEGRKGRESSGQNTADANFCFPVAIHSFTHSFIQQICVEHLLCVKHHSSIWERCSGTLLPSKCLVYQGKQDSNDDDNYYGRCHQKTTQGQRIGEEWKWHLTYGALCWEPSFVVHGPFTKGAIPDARVLSTKLSSALSLHQGGGGRKGGGAHGRCRAHAPASFSAPTFLTRTESAGRRVRRFLGLKGATQ